MKTRAAKALRRRSPATYALLRRVVHRVRRWAGRPPLRVALPMQGYTDLLPDKPQRTVVLIATSAHPRRVLGWLMQFHRDRVYVLAEKSAAAWSDSGVPFTFRKVASLDDIDEALTMMEPVHVIVDVSPALVEEHRMTWRKIYFHLEPGGVYVVDRGNARIPRALRSWLAGVTADGERAPHGFRTYAAATSKATLTSTLLIMCKRGKHYVKLRDPEVEAVLAKREPKIGVTELVRLPAGELVSTAHVVSHESSVPIPWLPERMHHPPMYLRHYTGRVAFYGGTLLRTPRSILPDSFRWQYEPRPRNPKLASVGDNFAAVTARGKPRESLEGDYFQVDPQFSGHFGHVMTEVVARLWGWDEAKRRFPELKAIFRVNNPDRKGEQFQRRLLHAYGIADTDIEVVDHPVFIPSLVSGTTMWHNAEPHYTHPALRDVWDRLRGGLLDPAAPVYDRVFVSRGEQFWRRSCRNVRDVEELFRAHDFEIIYPEDLDTGTQVGIFANAQVVAGFGGSALFNIMFATKLRTLIVLNHEAYIARNEHLYTSLLGCDVHYFWSVPDVPQPESFTSGADHRWSGDAFTSGWEFDFARNRGPVEELLKNL
jgi:hypothetical protein